MDLFLEQTSKYYCYNCIDTTGSRTDLWSASGLVVAAVIVVDCFQQVSYCNLYSCLQLRHLTLIYYYYYYLNYY